MEFKNHTRHKKAIYKQVIKLREKGYGARKISQFLNDKVSETAIVKWIYNINKPYYIRRDEKLSVF